MDFTAPPCVQAAIVEKTRHGIYGYFDTDRTYFQVLQGWFSTRFGFEIKPEWLVKTPGVVNAIHLALMAYTAPGDGVIIQQPVYYPFMMAIEKTGRKLVVNQLVRDDEGRYAINFEDFEDKITTQKVKAFILCSPHNPVGRVWTKEELKRLGQICARHGVTVISDEIHQDFVHRGHEHTVFSEADPDFGEISIICTAATKTFNLPALPMANIFIPNKKLREKFVGEYQKFGVSQMGVMEVTAAQAAYKDGGPWLEALLDYLGGNIELIDSFLETRLPGVKFSKPQGSYLAWLDFSGFGLSPAELEDISLHKAKVWLSNGAIFGAGGEGFLRMNTASPRAVIERALNQLEGAFGSL